MALPRLSYLDNYSTTAAGVIGSDTFIVVAATPADPADVTRDTVAIPISILDAATGAELCNTICTGWDSGDSKLFIDQLYISDITDPVTILCTPNKEVMAHLQGAQAIYDTIASGTYAAEQGVTHVLNVTGAATIEIEGAFITAWGSGYEQVFPGGQLTRLILSDGDGDQPAITWSASGGVSLYWAGGDDAQFAVGAAHLVVEIVGGGSSNLYGRYWSYP